MKKTILMCIAAMAVLGTAASCSKSKNTQPDTEQVVGEVVEMADSTSGVIAEGEAIAVEEMPSNAGQSAQASQEQVSVQSADAQVPAQAQAPQAK